MNNDNKLKRMVRACNTTAIRSGAARRTAARKAYRAKIESLLDASRDERLADMWQQVCPFAIDPAYELSNRRGIIKDLTDFAEAIQPSLDGLQADQLCRLIEMYAAGTVTFPSTAA